MAKKKLVISFLIILLVFGLANYADLTPKNCPDGMAYISEEEGGFCIFKYEASRSDANKTHEGNSEIATSQKNVVPWTEVTWGKAKQACEAAGYKLTTNHEWQAATEAVKGESESFVNGNNNFGKHENTNQSCKDDPAHEASEFNTSKGRCLTGTGPESWQTSKGVADLNGNVWEWTSTIYSEGGKCDLGENGYISSWNSTLNCPASLGPSKEFGNDYYWAPRNENTGYTVRGGAYQYQKEAGPYTIDLRDLPTNSLEYLGFRCSFRP